MISSLGTHWRSLLVVLLLCLVLVFLYQRTAQTKIERLYQTDALIQKIIAVDNAMEKDMMLLISGRLTHFDSLQTGYISQRKTSKLLFSLLEQNVALQPQTDALRATLALQAEPLETFKMKLSVLRNSLHYFPKLMAKMSKAYPAFQNTLLALSHEVLLMHLQGSEFDAAQFEALLQQLDEQRFKFFKRHLHIILLNYKTVDQSMYAFAGCGVHAAADNLLQAFHAQFDQEVIEANSYRMLLVFFALCLLLYAVLILWRLQASKTALEASHQFLGDLQHALDEHAIVTISNQRGDITYANDKFCTISGYTRDEVLGANHRLIKSDEHDALFFQNLWSTIVAGQAWHGVIKNKSKHGEMYWVDTTIIPFLNAAGKPWQYIAIRTDISDKVMAMRHVQESKAHYQLLTETIPEPVALAQKGLWVYLNPMAVKMFGFNKATELLGTKVLSLVADEGKPIMIKYLGQAKQQHVSSLQEISLCKADGQCFSAEFQVAAMHWQGEHAVLLAMRDITPRKADEEAHQLYQEQLEHSQRLESLGVLAGGIAHDFNNILTSILGNVSLAEIKVHEPKTVLSYLHKVKRASERAAELCQQMLMYSGGGAVEKKAISLAPLLHDMLDIAKVGMHENITLKLGVDDALPAIEADVRQIQQVMLNLLTNASEAMEGEGVIHVRLGRIDVGNNHIIHAVDGTNVAVGSYVYFEVKDAGCGMDKQTQSKIFEPFFTTKFTGRGLGMSAIQGIVSTHKGAISLVSSPQVGTTIRVYFPMSSIVLADDVLEKTQTVRIGSGSVLVIDDEEDILELLEAVLSGVGFTVLKAKDGGEGIEVFNAHADAIVAVVCDMVMPNVSGSVVAKYIHQHAPQVKIILSSGYDGEESMKLPQGLLAGFIQKPYAPQVLLNTVFQALED